jgi:hypothetical protein
VLQACGAFVVECNDALGRAAHVRYDEPDAGIKLSGMPLDFGEGLAQLASLWLIATTPDLEEFLRRSQDKLRTVLPGGSLGGKGLGLIVLAAEEQQ